MKCLTRPIHAACALLVLLAILIAVPAQSAQAQDPNQQEAQRIWQEAFENLQNGNYGPAAEGFIKLANMLPAGEMQAASYFNACCAYSLSGNKELGAVWFSTAVKAGFRDLEHINGDTDIDNIRDEPMVKKVIGLLQEKRFDELDKLDVDALHEQYYGAGSQPQPDPQGLTPEQRERLEALRRRMYEEIDRDLTATRNRLRSLVDEMIRKMAGEGGGDTPQPQPTPGNRIAYLGVTCKPIDDAVREFMGIPKGEGVLVDDLPADSPARRAGVLKLDVLLKVAGKTISKPGDIATVLASHKPGETVTVTVLRSGERKDIDVTLGGKDAPQDTPPPSSGDAPVWSTKVPSEPGKAIYGAGSGAIPAAAEKNAREAAVASGMKVFRTGTRRYLMAVIDRMEIRNLETYLDEMQADVQKALTAGVARATTAKAGDQTWVLARLPFDVLQDAVRDGCVRLLRNMGAGTPKVEAIREALRSTQHELNPPVAPPDGVGGEKVPALQGGVVGIRVAAGTDGLHVRDIVPGSPAAKAGLRANDVIASVDGTEITTLDGFRSLLEKHFVGDKLTLSVRRGAETLTIDLTIGHRQ